MFLSLILYVLRSSPWLLSMLWVAWIVLGILLLMYTYRYKRSKRIAEALPAREENVKHDWGYFEREDRHD